MERTDVKKEALPVNNSDAKALEGAHELLDRIKELQESGAMDSLLQILQAASLVRHSATDSMVNKNASMLSDLMEVASEAASPEVLESLRELKKVHRSGKLKDLSEITDAIPLILNTLTEKMLERNITMIGSLIKIANEAADPEMIEAVRELKNLQRSGNLKSLSEASYTVGLMANVITDSMVQRMASLMSAFVEEVSTPQMQDILRSTTRCMSRTIQEFATTPPEPGMKNLLGLMRDPEVRMGMMFMATLSKNMYKSLMETYSGE